VKPNENNSEEEEEAEITKRKDPKKIGKAKLKQMKTKQK